MKERITALKEFPVAEYKHHTNFNIGKHTIVTENHQQFADVTRDPGTNTFRVTGKNTGTVQIDCKCHYKTNSRVLSRVVSGQPIY